MHAISPILAQLRIVEAERERRIAEPGLGSRVRAIKEYQQRRFCHTYADLLQSARYGPASRFFLEELYGPTDFSQRDAQFARVVPTLVRLFPREIVDTVAVLAQLHALSERLDTLMGLQLSQAQVDATTYVLAWRGADCKPERERQVELTLDVAASLDRLTRKPLIRNSLRLMRGPARAAGLGDLQQFLEKGFDTFKAMNGAQEFMALVGQRERTLAYSLFAPGETPAQAEGPIGDILGLLPRDPP